MNAFAQTQQDVQNVSFTSEAGVISHAPIFDQRVSGADCMSALGGCTNRVAPVRTDLSRGQTAGQDMTTPSMRAFGPTRAPFGHVGFCARNPEDCKTTSLGAPLPALNSNGWSQMSEINLAVNRAVAPVTDLDLYNTVEYWTYPGASGDCEDYVLAKQRMLIARGWPASSLLITVVRDEDNLGHAVLTVTTDRGDFILDNKSSAILRWQDTPYRYVKRQSQADPRAWLSLSATEDLRLSSAPSLTAQQQ